MENREDGEEHVYEALDRREHLGASERVRELPVEAKVRRTFIVAGLTQQNGHDVNRFQHLNKENNYLHETTLYSCINQTKTSF